MQTIHIVAPILFIIANIGMTTLVVYLFQQHRKTKGQIDFIAFTVSRIFALVSSMKVQANFDKITEMQKLMLKLAKDENFEEANKLKVVIEESTKSAYKAYEAFKDTFGEDVAASVISIQMKRP